MEKCSRGKFLHFEWKMVICWKTLTLACLYTYTANQQGDISWEKDL